MLPKCAYYRYILPHLIVFVNPYLQARIRLYTSIRLDTPLFSLYYLYMPTPNNLQNLGLSADQTAIYLTLLSSGPQSAISLAKLSGIKRTYIYHLCKELEKEGHIKLAQKGRTTYFSAQSPDLLLAKAQEKKALAETALLTLQSILPELQSKYRLTDTKPVVSYFEGLEGIKKVYLDTLTATTPILALVETSSVEPEIYQWVTKEYVKERIKKGINVQAIVETGDKTSSYIAKNEAELRESKTVPATKHPFEHEINIYDDKVALINHRAGTKLLGIIIDNKDVATTFRSWFELTWRNI